MSETESSTQKPWRRLLIEPRPSVTGEERRQRAQITSVLTLILLAVSTLIIVMGLFSSPADTIRTGVPSTLVILVAYLLSRTRRPEWGAWLLVIGWSVVNVVILASITDPDITSRAIAFVLVPVLFSMIIMPARVTVALSGLTVMGLILFPVLAPWLEFRQVTVPLAVTALISALAGAAAFLRERDLTTIRIQAENLGRYSQELRQEVDERTRRITATAEVGRAITGARDLDKLLKQVVNLIVENFDFYHAQVFLIDEVGQDAVLRESTGLAGQELLARGHKLSVGSRSVIGQVTSKGEAIIASDTDTDPVHRRNELLPHTRSEMALPLRISGRVIGALDVQSVNPAAFTPEDIPVFQTMADQLAIAIENTRLFERAQHDLEDIEALNRQLTGQAWSQFLARGAEPVGYRVDEKGMRPIKTEEEAGQEPGEGTISLPLMVRGQTIGTLDLASRSGQAPDEDTQLMLEAVAERVAMALDSARLGEQSRTQAETEQILSRISAELQATTDMDVILRIASRELSRALGAPRSFVYLTTREK